MNPLSIIPKDILLGLFVAGLLVWETLRPFRAVPARLRHDRHNFSLAVLNGGALAILNALILVPVVLWAEEAGGGLLRVLPLPPLVAGVLAFVAFDFWMYCWHRLNHQWTGLWRIHRVHHTDPALNLSSAFRFHPVELTLSTFLNVVVLLLLGISLAQFLWYKVIFNAVVLFHHSNVRLPLSVDQVLRRVIVTPQMHRVHHSDVPEETNSNYGSVFSAWDRLWGSMRDKNSARIRYGLDRFMEEPWQSVTGLLRLPFLSVQKNP